MFLNLIRILLFVTYSSLSAQVILTEVMFDPSGPEGAAEYIEIYNAGSEPADLSGWKIGEQSSLDNIIDAGEGLLLDSGQYGLVLDPDDFELTPGNYDGRIPMEALVITLDGNTFGSRGLSNSTEETVLLVNAGDDTVQTYTYSLDNEAGISDEKIELLPDNWPGNWGNSRAGGSPGARNSLTRYESDITLIRFRRKGSLPVAGASFRWTADIKNIGRLAARNISVVSFVDLNRNGQAEDDEIHEMQVAEAPLAVNDSVTVGGRFETLHFGEQTFGVLVEFAADQNPANNVDTTTIFVDDPSRQQLVINEIMFEPHPGASEWIEIYNAGADAVDLASVFFADVRDTVRLSDQPHQLLPGQYLVVSEDSAVIQAFSLPAEQVVVPRSFPTLNNDVDDLSILGPTLVRYDYLRYSELWYRRDVGAGISIEKLNPQFDGALADNWAASVEGATPGRQNSIYLTAIPLSTDARFYPNPFSPDGDGFEDHTLLQFYVEAETAFVNARIYDLRGRLIRHWLSAEPVAADGRFIWDGRDENGRFVRIGAYIALLEFLNIDKALYRTLKKTIVVMKR